MQEQEAPLSGGNSSRVVQVGKTVRRATGQWSPGVQALLTHLEVQGFRNAPEFLGLDEQGREMLTFIAGEVGNYPLARYMWSDEVLVEVAHLIRRYHDATVGFVSPREAYWQIAYPDRSRHEVMCHNDLAPYNMVYTNGKPCALIDFDNAGPGPREWDMAHAAYRFVPLIHWDNTEIEQAGLTDLPTQARRLQLFCDSYGIAAHTVLKMVEPRLQTLCDTIQERAAAGNSAFQTMLAEGHLRHYEHELLLFQAYYPVLKQYLSS